MAQRDLIKKSYLRLNELKQMQLCLVKKYLSYNSQLAHQSQDWA